MAKGNVTFKHRVSAAVETLIDASTNKLEKPVSYSLFMLRKGPGGLVWAKLMQADGLLLRFTDAKHDEAAECANQVRVLRGIIVQTEETTSNTVPDPLGKAFVPTTPGGVWVDLGTTTRRNRVRIDFPTVLFVTPKPTSTLAKVKADFAKRKGTLDKVVAASPFALLEVVNQGDSQASIAAQVLARVSSHL